MIHQYQSKNQIRNRRKFIRIILILILFFIVAFSGVLPFIVKMFNYVAHPVWEMKKVAVDGTNSLSYLTRSKSSLLEENRKLIDDNLGLKVKMIALDNIKKENEALKELLGRTIHKADFVLASILTKPSFSPYDSINIDIGEKEGVYSGAKVYANGDIPIGIVSAVYMHSSLVELYSNPGKVTEGIIEGQNINVGIIGRGGGNFEMSVPIDVSITKGTIITLPGISGDQLAVVDGDITDKTEANKKYILRSLLNIQNQRWVQVKIK